IAGKDGDEVQAEIAILPVSESIGADYVVYLRDISRTKGMEIELGQMREEVDLLRDIMPKLQSTLDYKKLAFTVLHRVMEVFGWGIGAIFMRDAKETTLRLIHTRAFPESILDKLRTLETDEGIGGYCAKTLEPHHFLMKKYPSFLPYRALFRDAGITELLFIPLVSGESLVGLMFLGSKKEPVPRKEAGAVLSALGNNLGSALWTARTLSEVRATELNKTELINSSPDILYTGTLSGSFVTVNSTIEKLAGYSPREFLRTPSLWLRLVHPDDKRILLERVTRIAEIPRQAVYEYRVLPKGKAVYRWVRDIMTIVKDERGEPVSIFGTITDITDQKLLVDRLQAENAIQVGIVEGMEDGIAAFDRRMMCIAWNPSLSRMTGTSGSSALGKSAAELLPKFEEASLGKLFSDVLEGAVVTTPDIPYRHHETQKTGYFLGRFSPMRGPDGSIVGIVAIIIDVSAQKHLQEEMRESDQILTNVIDTMGDMLVITDLRGRVLQVNRAFLRVLGYSRAEALDTDFPYPWLIEDEMGRFVVWTSTIRERMWLHDFDMTWRTKDLRHIPVSLSTTLLRNSLGEPFAMLNIARDITERTNLSRGLEHRNKQIEAINRIISKANQTNDVDEIFSTLAKEIDGLLAADAISLELLDERMAVLESHALLPKRKYLKEHAIPLEQSATRLVMESKRPLLISDLTSAGPPAGLIPAFKGIQSYVSLPIIVNESVYGTLTLGSLETHTFTEEDIQLLSPIVQQLGSILDRLRLFKQVSEDAAYTRTLLDSMESVVCTIDSQLRIREVNNAWYSFVREMGAHGVDDYRGLLLYDVLPGEHLKSVYRNIAAQMLRGEMRAFLEEFTQETPEGDKTYQLTVNPMVISRQIIGLVFTHTDITSVKKTEEDLKRNNEQLLVLNQIAALISSTFDFDEVLRKAVPLFQRMMRVDAILVYLTETNSKDLRLAGQTGFDPNLYPSIRVLEQKKSVTGDVVVRKEAVYIEDGAARDERVNPDNRKVLEYYGIRSMAAIPIVAKENVLGALDIFSSQAHEYSDRERQMLLLIGNQLGVAIKNTQLYDEIRSQLSRLTVLYELSQKLTSTLNIEEIFQTTCEHVRDLVDFAGFTIDLYDEKSHVKIPAFSVEVQNGKETFVISRGQPVPVGPGTLEDRVIREKTSCLSPGLHEVCIPMMSKESIIGIVTIRGNDSTKYNDNQRLLLESIGNLTAIALEKGKLYEETLQKSLEIERRNKELDDFTYVVSHDLKEPLISIEGFSKILQSDFHEVISTDGKEYLDSIVGSTTRMKGLIDDLLLLSRVSRPSESFRKVPMNDLLGEITRDMEYTFKKRNVSVVVPEELPVVYGNETQLKIVLRNLIGNAVKFNDKPTPTVTIGFQNTENNSYLFSVTDNGIGIEKEFFEKIFVIFQRLHRREEYEGSGAGLAIVKKIIELHKGRIWVESEPGKGSAFFFTVPKPLSGEP
ncbi:MAG TPA: GAF domain-containing protein, partial [Bacteroidota bacterium]|nr:GAF domain-containing protein [Bacteroidota bacterium]